MWENPIHQAEFQQFFPGPELRRQFLLSPNQLRDFNDNGYLVLDDIIDRRSVLEPLIREYEEVLDRLRTGWIAEGKLDGTAPIPGLRRPQPCFTGKRVT